MKYEFEAPELIIILFDSEDVITVSGDTEGDNELDFIPDKT